MKFHKSQNSFPDFNNSKIHCRVAAIKNLRTTAFVHPVRPKPERRPPALPTRWGHMNYSWNPPLLATFDPALSPSTHTTPEHETTTRTLPFAPFVHIAVWPPKKTQSSNLNQLNSFGLCWCFSCCFRCWCWLKNGSSCRIKFRFKTATNTRFLLRLSVSWSSCNFQRPAFGLAHKGGFSH